MLCQDDLMPPDDVPELIVADADGWRAWLVANHDQSSGVWLAQAKKGTVEPTSLTYAEAVDEALCFGWIDGQRVGHDDATFRQRYTPRRARSPWSKRNVGIVERLIADRRMHAAGLAEVERAKADGRWDAAYAGQADSDVPPDLAAALEAEPRAAAMFAILTRANRYSILYRLESAKRAETRARRLDQFVAMLARGETIHPQKRTLES
jgi:uncharacterized protein YdeI (YjbR/CyaY-like superfamily)